MTDPAWTQLGLLEDTDLHTFARNEVLAIDASHTTNGQRVKDLAKLGYLPEPVLDPTYGYGSMWTDYMPEVLYACDLDPEKSPTGVARNFTDLPFEDNSFGSCLYDPPYRFAGTPTDTDDGGHDDLYGTDVYRTKAEQIALIVEGAKECGRVTSQFLIVKCQDQVVANFVGWQTAIVKDFLEDEGWRLKDSLLLLSYRPQPAGRSQNNARRNYSSFLIFASGR